MEIIVNQEPIDFELTEVISLSEVLNKLSEWAANKKLFIIEYIVKPIQNKSISKKEEQELSTNEINKLEVLIGTEKDLLIENIYNLNQYVEKLGVFLASSIQNKVEISSEEKINIKEGFYWIHEVTSLMLEHHLFKSKNAVNIRQNRIKEILSTIYQYAETELPNKEEEMFSFLDDLGYLKFQVEIWNKIAVFYNFTEEELKDLWNTFILEIPNILDKLENIATQFTLSKENEAIPILEGIIHDLSDSITIINLLNKSKLNEWQSKIVKMLQEILELLDNKDYVTVADILDYDLKELLESKILHETDS